ncbi:MAG: PKD domain-containing protein [Flavobacteriales bacterium]
MKIKNILQALVLILSVSQSIGQFAQGTTIPAIPGKTVPFAGEQCASHYMDEFLLRQDPAYKAMRDQIEIVTQQYIQSQAAYRSAGRGVVYTIPIVFHIMHEGEAVGDSTNISDAQVLSCIAALNRDFRRNGADGGIAQGGPLGIDAEIEFCLASKDPNGNFTNGITRHDMSGIQGYLDSGVYHQASWRSDVPMKTMVQWNPAQYLNVWVVNKIKSVTNIYAGGGGGVIGYATFPGGSAASDGVVIRFSATGNDISGTSGFNLWSATNDGRVLTHELGHYLNLYHTFQSTSTCTPGTPCATSGDLCCDTPPTTVGTGNACTTPVCPLDNKENYMQYQNGSCASDFTPNQVTRMRAVLAPGGPRNSLVTTQNCVSPYQVNPLVAAIIYPSDTVCSNIIPGYSIVCNGGSDTLTSFNIQYSIDAATPLIYPWTGSLAPNQCDTVILPQVVTTTGSHSYNVSIDTVQINGNQNDNFTADNALSSAFYSKDGFGVVIDITTDCKAQETSWILKDTSGTVILQGSGYSQIIQTIFETACLDTGCYVFTIYDAGGDGLQKNALCPTDGKFEVTDVSTGQTIAKSLNANFGDSATFSFCMPFTSQLTPGFTGCDTVYPTYPVFLTDTSISYPAAFDWKWDFGDGTFSSLRNPTKGYSNVGTYNVKLVIENITAKDSITKAGCVVVIPTPPGFCDTLDNYDRNLDSMIFYDLQGNWGYFPGHNGANLSGYAEPFNLPGPLNSVQRVILPVVKAYAGTPTSTFVINIFDDNMGEPGAVLSSDTILYSSLVEGVSNEIYLTTPPFITGDFWAGIEINYGTGDTLVLTSALHRIGGVNTTYVKTAGLWQSSALVAALNTSTGIRVIYTDLPAQGNLTVTRNRICQGQTTTFAATGLANYDSLKWFFPGGTPSFSTNINQTVSYTAPGTYKAILYLEGICSNDSLITTITVDTLATTASFTESSLLVCEQDSVFFDGTLSGAATIEWTYPSGIPATSSQEDNTVFFTTPGVYTVKMKAVNGCGSDSVSKVITVRSYPTTVISPGDTTICDGQSIALSTTGGFTYSWSTGATTSTINVSPSATTQYWSVASNGNCPGDTGYMTITNNPIPTVVANATPDTVCQGDAIYFSITGSNATTYDWDFGDLNTSTTANTTHTYAAAGIYTATLRGVFGVCDNTNTTQVVVVNCTGIDEQSFAKSIVVYPNPANHYLNISMLEEQQEPLQVSLINSTGQVVYNKNYATSDKMEGIDLLNFAEGVYLIRFTSNKKSFTKKVVVMR